MEIEIYFDGAVLGNGQPNAKSGIGVVVKIDGKTTHKISEVVDSTTSNQCEWEGLLCALDLAVRGRKKYPDANICLYGDSKMVVEQINDRWQHDKFMLYYDSAINMKYAPNSIEWIPREENEEADELSNKAVGIMPKDVLNIEIRKEHFQYLVSLVGKQVGIYRNGQDKIRLNEAKDVYTILKIQEKGHRHKIS